MTFYPLKVWIFREMLA